MMMLMLLLVTELDKKQAGLLSRTEREVDTLTLSIEKAATIYNERIDGDYIRRIGKAEDKLNELPDAPEVKTARDKLSKLKARRTELSTALADKNTAKANDAAEVAALVEGANLEEIASLREQFDNPRRYMFDHYLYDKWPGHEMVEEMRKWSEGWDATKKQWAELSSKYARVTSQAGGPKGVTLAIALKDAASDYPAFEAAVTAFTNDAPAEIDKAIAATRTAMRATEYHAFMRSEEKRWRVNNLFRVWEPLAKDASAVKQKVDALEADHIAAANKLSEMIIKENRAAPDAYTAGDRAELEAFVRAQWAKLFGKESIVAVRFTSQAAERHTAWQWNGTQFQKVDYSTALGWVYVKDGAHAIQWGVGVRRDHLKGNTLSLNTTPRPQNIPPTQKMLLSHFK